MFVGTALGTVIQSVGEEISGEMAELVGEYVEKIGHLSRGEQVLLSDPVKEALA